ncbi:hypothetical protein F4778DRAFT_795065 [Xylariomycetidae sp. FL2044]|nr:hypothetical protein F4778DRAFT_795065 [Xylariomycetidae sp. FL2044]
MSDTTVYEVRPTGWEADPEEERFKVSTIDRTPVCAYNHYVVFFRVGDAEKEKAVEILKQGLEKTLSQARYMCGTIERDPEGGHSFVKRRDTAVKLVVRKLDGPEGKYPSVDEIEKAHFAAKALGDLNDWSIPSMTWGERPEADPDRSPAIAAYQLNMARGGLVFSMHSHHYASDVMGWSNFTRQLADNCLAVTKGTSFPDLDPACLDVSRFTKDLPEDQLVDGPPIPQRHPGHPEQQAVLFHLPKSKAAKLKELATPAEPDGKWISTYDAMNAYMWRRLSSVRAPLYQPDLSKPLYWGEAVNMRPRLRSPPVPERMMRNVVAGAFSPTAPVAAPTAGEVISEAPLARLAAYIRALTDSCTEAHFEALVSLIAPVRDKRGISLRVDAEPPMSVFVTDHRSGDITAFDFGFGRPLTYRHFWGDLISAGLVLVYAPIRKPDDPDEGCMFTVTMEKELVPKLLEDPEWSEYFEYRGVD